MLWDCYGIRLSTYTCKDQPSRANRYHIVDMMRPLRNQTKKLLCVSLLLIIICVRSDSAIKVHRCFCELCHVESYVSYIMRYAQ